jgi:hypothetical protein
MRLFSLCEDALELSQHLVNHISEVPWLTDGASKACATGQKDTVKSKSDDLHCAFSSLVRNEDNVIIVPHLHSKLSREAISLISIVLPSTP